MRDNDCFHGRIVYLSELLSTAYASKLHKEFILKFDIFNHIYQYLKFSEGVELYFTVCIKNKIYPFIFNEIKNNYDYYNKQYSIKAISDGSFFFKNEMLSYLMSQLSRPLSKKYQGEWCYRMTSFVEKNSYLNRRKVKNLLNLFMKVGLIKQPEIDAHDGLIAIQYGEGFNLDSRSDIFWLINSGISEKRVLIFFEHMHLFPLGEKKRIREFLKTRNFQKVCLHYPMSYFPFWQPNCSTFRVLLPLKLIPKSEMDKWILRIGTELIEDVYYWEQFIKKFNVKIMFVKDERMHRTIAQKIAFDSLGHQSGLLISHQRSELFYPPISTLGTHPKDLLFCWNQRCKEYFSPNVEKLRAAIVTGYPYNLGIKNKTLFIEKWVETLKKTEGVQFFITLFDNIPGGISNPITVEMVRKFYYSFIEWALMDNIGLIIKSKKQLVFDRVADPKLLTKIKLLQKTQKCILLEHSILPADAARYSNISIGIGISSALTEAIISGARGVYCDLTQYQEHIFYQWGNKKNIFDNLGEMMRALKKFKENPDDNLGDWSFYKDKLDPYGDGLGGQRMGVYIKWLLEGFEKKYSRDESVQYANILFMNTWGKDKVYLLQDIKQALKVGKEICENPRA